MIGKAGTKESFGQMRQRFELQGPSETRDSETGEVLRPWVTIAERQPASFHQVSGGEFLRGRQVSARASAIFVTNYRSDYSTTQRVVFDGVNYEIVRVHIPQGIKRFAELECRAVGL